MARTRFVRYTSVASPPEDTIAGFTYPGSPTEEFVPQPLLTTHLVWNQTASGATVPALSTGMMAVWWSRPEALQAGFWSGFFHAAYLSATWGGGSADASDTRYVGAHPYPISSQNRWEISANLADETLNDLSAAATITQWQRKYVHILLATPSGGNVNYRFYYDYATNPARYIEVTGDSKSDPAAADRGIMQGDAFWNRGNERFNGPLSMPDLYFGKTFTLTDADAAIANPLDGSLTSYLWFTNRYPTSNADISDKSGNGNNPVWVIGGSVSTPALYQEP